MSFEENTSHMPECISYSRFRVTHDYRPRNAIDVGLQAGTKIF